MDDAKLTGQYETDTVSWSHAHLWYHNERFIHGTPTDDTLQDVLILYLWVQNQISCSRSVSNRSVFEYPGVRIDRSDFVARLAD
jgi:hypothetical protein